MSSGVVSQRYAKALLNLAEKGDRMEAVTEGLDDIADSLSGSEELRALLVDAKVPQTVKRETMDEVLEQARVQPLVATFIRFITHKRRISLLEEIRKIFHLLADERQGRAHARVTVASELSAREEEQLRTRLEARSGKQITLDIQVEPEIIGGAITKIGSTVQDGSLRTQLKNIRRFIKEG